MPAPGAKPDGGILRIAAFLGWIAAGIGMLVLAGWASGSPLLRDWISHPIRVAAKPNAAICFVLIGVALALKTGRTRRVRAANLCAAGAVLIALLTLAEYLFQRNLGIDQLFFRETTAGLTYPGRMALPAAACLLLLGLGVLGLDSPRRAVAGVLALPAVVLAGLAFVGYLYDLPVLTTFGIFTPMAPPVGVTLLAIGAGLALAAGGELIAGLQRSGPMAALLGGLFLLLLLGGGVARSTAGLISNGRRVTHTYEVLDRLGRMFTLLQDIESSARGYVLTGDPVFLESAGSAPAEVARLETELRDLTRDNPVQQRRLYALQTQVDRKLAANAEQVALRRRGDLAAAQELVADGRGRRAMEVVRRGIAELRAEEGRLLLERGNNLEASTGRTLITLATGLGAACLLLLGSFSRLRREVVRRTELAAALQRSEESLAITLNSIGDGVLATDTAGRIIRLNPVAEQLTGWTIAAAHGRPVEEVFRIIHEHTRQAATIPVAEVLATGRTMELANHTLLIARDGTERPIADSAAPIRDAGGHLLGVVLVFRDVTGKYAAQKALEESEARYRSLFNSIDEGFCIIGMIFDAAGEPADYRFLEINQSFEKQTGLRDAQGKRMRELAPQHEAHWFEVYGRIALTGEPARFQHRAEQLGRTYDVYAFRFGAPEDRRVGILFNDITQRQQAEDRVREANARLESANVELNERRAELQSLFESLPGLYLVLTPAHVIVGVSDAYLKATMTTREGILHRNLFDVFPDNPGDPKADGVRNLRASLERVAQTGAPDTMSIQKYDVRRPDGVFEERYWSPINSPLFGSDRRIRYIIHRAEDVTEFVKHREGASADGTALRRRLEQMEMEIYASSQQVAAANAQLHLANKELESFSYSVSHDLRAPLRHIQGYVEMLTRDLQGQLSDKAARYLKTIADAGREMGELIDDLLAFSRMGRAEMAEGEVDLAPIVAEVRRGLELATQGREISWKTGPLPRVRGDAAMLRQVLANLLGNAVKYTRGRAPAEIEIGCAGTEEGRTVFFVRDNGAGFEMKYADKLFGVFQRLHRADEFEGTGIGLASVRRIVARHGGRTWAEGRPQAGATFYFSLHPIPTPTPVAP